MLFISLSEKFILVPVFLLVALISHDFQVVNLVSPSHPTLNANYSLCIRTKEIIEYDSLRSLPKYILRPRNDRLNRVASSTEKP